MESAEAERFARLRLARSGHVGPISFMQLLRRFGSASAALEGLPDLARRGGSRGFALAPVDRIERERAAVRAAGASYLMLGDEDYPATLAELVNAPPVLIVKGQRALLALPMVAVVGARNASAAACRFARQLSFDLAAGGVCVVSGLARGIDTAAHVGALGGGAGGTIGVIASGIDIAFPPENRDLQARLGEEQLVIAEQPPGSEPLARHFPHRNRIIAGVAGGTVVVEAAPRSGSLITARLAAEYGREVMAVPGSPLDPRAQGCNSLIRDGATLVQNAGDVIESISAIGGDRPRDPAPRLDFREEEGAAPTDAQADERARIAG